MIYSMTAFGRSQTKADWGMATWEVRSVNHRYLEINVRLPEMLRELEQGVREIIHQFVHRGKVECSLRFQPGQSLAGKLVINQELLNQLIESSLLVQKKLPAPLTKVNIIDLLAWDGVIVEETLDLSTIKQELLTLFKHAMQQLKEGRRREGAALAQTIQERLTKLRIEIQKITKLFPDLLQQQREKIVERLEEVTINLDAQRLEQEMVYYSQRMDISEEIDRALSHIAEVERCLAHERSAGRRLDFMMQELNREANTLASKSFNPEITHAAVEMKVLIEQMREQVQNIE